ncbi:MAG: hypothetical protein Cons2KO_27230 [Congregibacter sp.]
MKRGYVNLDAAARGQEQSGWQIHYRETGHSDVSCVLLHPSPLSSESMIPVMQALSPQMRCVAWDTPGYGMSDPLPHEWSAGDLSPYVHALVAFIKALDLNRPILYGSATGAQIAIEFSKQHPQHCGGLLLENLALFSDEERASMLPAYFPKATPRDDGGHLSALWNMARDSTRYFPWYARGPEAERRSAYPDAQIINMITRDYLLAGSNYDRAYRAAFENESLAQLQAVTISTRIVLWEDGLLGEYGERLASAELPGNMLVRRAPAGMPQRMQTVIDSARELLELRGSSQC